jgi:hypothetical protein
VSGRAAPERWTREALRLNARYVEEIVVGWSLCPWAAQAWRTGAVSRRVSLERDAATQPVLSFVDELAAGDQAIGLFIWPRLSLDAAGFGRFAEQVRRADRARHAPPFLMAAFHPELRDEPPADPASLVPFIRRTPDPTLQLVRARLLDELARGGRDVSAELARANFAVVERRTPAALDRALRDIQRDRDDTYASLAAAEAAID